MKRSFFYVVSLFFLFMLAYAISLNDYGAHILQFAPLFLAIAFLAFLVIVPWHLYQVYNKKTKINWFFITFLPVCFFGVYLGVKKVESAYNSNEELAHLIVNEIRKNRTDKGYPENIDMIYMKHNISNCIGIFGNRRFQYSISDRQFILSYTDQHGTWHEYRSVNASWTEEQLSL